MRPVSITIARICCSPHPLSKPSEEPVTAHLGDIEVTPGNSLLLISRTVQRLRQSLLAEIDNRASQDAAGRVDAQPGPAAAVEEAQPKFPLMGVNTPLAKAGDGVRPHEGRYIRRDNVQEFAQQRGIDQNIAIDDLDLCEAIFGYHFRLLRAGASAGPRPIHEGGSLAGNDSHEASDTVSHSSCFCRRICSAAGTVGAFLELGCAFLLMTRPLVLLR
jgi:hypothetical protein